VNHYNTPDIGYNFYFHIIHVCRVKVEIQLISWLNKYDTDIGKKQAEYDEVLAGYEKEQQQMETLKVKQRLNCTLIRYLPLTMVTVIEGRTILQDGK